MGAPTGYALSHAFALDAKWDLSALPYNDWLDLIFKHPDDDDEWCWRDEWSYRISNNQIILEYLIELFERPRLLLDRYSESQLERGFWFLMGPAGFSDVAWDKKIAFERRAFFIRQHATLFKELFADYPLETSVQMWWDLFESGYSRNQTPTDTDDAALQETILWTLGDILGMNESHCVCSALHGLNHLHHPRVPEFIDYFLATNRWLNQAEYVRAYALDCREGKAL